ncbi:uncharacterized protein Z518_00016 [Rhinocladiella mackenziei CBS 650.93]|uniref:Polycomb protein VEFS-Box domain-containing protein n=1 Tax=Rhinocladiella mackenziei CBS 650.93 TaxID=1442369 RepID=A0A0D2HEE3_9EURO|nr:uncharacterized protein Z518_00016 [Rhinocladiella mackenziei CBS 650.93]KIX08938.1 hypothetical protein Z518_00016 [Rhinocladiella mackenziei CBS 650.93]
MLNFDYNFTSSRAGRRFSRYLIGDFTFALEQSRSRQKPFLQRNITRVLAYHQKRRERNFTPSILSKKSPSKSRESDDSPGGIPSEESSINIVAPVVASNGSETSPNPEALWSQDRQPPTNIAMGSKSQLSLQNAGENERNTRRSIRSLLDKAYEQPDAELTLDLSNIRKKLNFKTNFLDESERPAKRRKRDSVRCQCHLTIWDNRDGCAAIPLTTKSAYCRVTATETVSDGYFVDVELDKPFLVRAAELKVSIDTKQGSILGIIDKYFLEIKIIPCKADSPWPPMPILGKSDGDHFARDIRKTGSEELQGAVVARYTHLPQAPESDVPLSIFFLYEGRTYRTKYGLQVISTWRKGSSGSKPVKTEKTGLELDSFWAEKPNGINLPNGMHKESNLSKLVQPRPPEVCYNFCSTISTQADQDFRVATVKGYRCPLCAIWKSSRLNNLQFHLSTMHSKYRFSVQKPRRDPSSNELTHIQIKVDLAAPVRKEEDTKSFEWQAPEKPFDLPAYVEGDHSWLGVSSYKKSPLNEPVPNTGVKRPVSGFLPAKDVPDFRKPQRKKFRAITLETKYAEAEPVYTSISHRPVSPSEESRSETDDEIDNEWQIQLHMERLDLIGTREGWNDYERELRKRWDRHRMEEQLEHSRYLSNSLIRFVRKNRSWLKDGDDQLLLVFFEFLEQLKERGVIDDNVVCDVNELIFQNAPAASPTPKPAEINGALAPRKEGVRTRSQTRSPYPNELNGIRSKSKTPQPRTPKTTAPPPNSLKAGAFVCGICSQPIKHMIKDVIWCKDPECKTPRTMYHRQCAQSHRGTKCQGRDKNTSKPTIVEMGHDPCMDLRWVMGRSSGSGSPARPIHDNTEAAAESTGEFDASNWSCRACIARQNKAIKTRDLATTSAMPMSSPR